MVLSGSPRLIVSALAFLASCSTGAIAEGPADVSIWVPTVSGQPGEEVAIEFWATTRVPSILFLFAFDVDPAAADFVRTETKGTASSSSPPRNVVYNPRHSHDAYSGYLAGAGLPQRSPQTYFRTGNGLLFLKAVFRIHPDALPGDYPIHIQESSFVGAGPGEFIRSLEVAIQASGALRVVAPSGPRPIGNLQCSQEGRRVLLSWRLTEEYETILVRRGAVVVATLHGAATRFSEEAPPGPATYQVSGYRGGTESVPGYCDMLVQVPRPKPPTGLTCASSESGVALAWENGEEYQSIQVLRNGGVLATLEGAATAYADDFHSNLFAVYTVRGRAAGIDSLPANCLLNALSDEYVIWAEEVHAQPGERNVPVRIFATNPRAARGLEFGLSIDPRKAAIRDSTPAGAIPEAAQAEFFGYQVARVDSGEVSCGILTQFVVDPLRPADIPAGADQPVATVFADVLPGVPEGTRIPVEVGPYGDPTGWCVFTVGVDGVPAAVRPGSILVGASPIPPVEGAIAQPEGRGGDVVIHWENPIPFSEIVVEVDGRIVGRLDGDSTSFVHTDAGPGMHRYRILAILGDEESFPVLIDALPRGVPGTFIRGDIDGSGRLDLADALRLIAYLFQGGDQPSCIDAADADDSGKVDLVDVQVLLFYLFSGARPLPAPGPLVPWFDPTKDDLTCG